jgi:Flp pilus assembly protein TadD
VQAPQRELYDQNYDPPGAHNIASTAPAIADTLAAWTDELRRSTASAVSAAAAKLDPEQAQKLSALGYVASETPAAGADPAAASDPKDKIEIANLMHDAILEIEEGQNETAIAKLERVIEGQPNMPIAQMQLGTALTRTRNYERALPVLHHALELQPDNAMGHYELGLAFFETGDWKCRA